MPLPVKTEPLQRSEFDRDMIDAELMARLVSQCDLRGYDAPLWAYFRYPNLLTSAARSKASLTGLRPSREQLACVLFDVQLQVLRGIGFRYGYTANKSLWLPGEAAKSMELSCLGLTRSFAALLYAFGFKPEELYAHKSNPTDDVNVKLAMREAFDAADVQGADGAKVTAPYDPATSPPTADELSNGFKLVRSGPGLFAVGMVPRDPFLNHYCVYVEAGFTFPYFDPLSGGRYKNGQGDLFAAYNASTGPEMTYQGEKVKVYAGDDPRARLYKVPAKMDFPGSVDFARARKKYDHEIQGLWLVIDPEDWTAQAAPRPRRRCNALTVSQFEPFAQGGPASPVGPGRHPDKIVELYGSKPANT
jgi:hypothetical protein